MLEDIRNIYIGARYRIDGRDYIIQSKESTDLYSSSDIKYLESDDLMQEVYQNYKTHWLFNLRDMLLYWGRTGIFKKIELMKENKHD